MPIDTSMYSNLQPDKVELPSMMDSAQRAMSLSQMGMQQAQMQRQMMQQQAMMQAHAQNTDPTTGQVNKQGVLSTLGKMGMGHMVPEMAGVFAKQDKEIADAHAAQSEAASKMYNVTGPAFDHMKTMPEDQRAVAYPKMIQQLKDQGVDVSTMDHPYDKDAFDKYYGAWQQSKPHLENLVIKSNIAQAPAKLAAEQFGSRSPNATISSQYSDDPAVKNVKSSQVAMNQMHDAYRHPSPYSDESLALNAMKIKFPGAPDVQSLEEFKNAQGATDAMKNYVSKKLLGIKAPGAREDLMRDAISTYLPNVETFRGAQKKYLAKATNQGVPNAADIVNEPGIDESEATTRALAKEIGPYVPPTERPGTFMAGVSKFASKLTGGALGGVEQSANAGEVPKQAKAPVASASDKAALDYLKTADKSDPVSFKIRAKLKAKGLL